MIIRKSLLGLTAVGLVFGSTAAAAAPVAGDRAASQIGEAEELAGIGTFGLLLGLLVVAGVLAIVLSDDDDEEPVSP